MAAFQYVSRTITFPVRASGAVIVDNAGRHIATAPTAIMADAIADAMNLGEPAVLAREADYEQRERTLAKMVKSQHEHDRMERTLAIANKAHALMG
jgi:hypothetical protein